MKLNSGLQFYYRKRNSDQHFAQSKDLHAIGYSNRLTLTQWASGIERHPVHELFRLYLGPL